MYLCGAHKRNTLLKTNGCHLISSLQKQRLQWNRTMNINEFIKTNNPVIYITRIHSVSCGSSVDIARFLAQPSFVSTPRCSVCPYSRLSKGYMGLFILGVKRPGREADHSPPSTPISWDITPCRF
jgi:hypothetical protein